MFGKGLVSTFLSIFALFTAQNAATTTKFYLDPNDVCTLLFDGAKIVDDNNCAGYYTCNEGNATAGTCSSGLYFNKDKQACLSKSEVSCKNRCTGVEDGKFVPMGGSCSGYYYCKNEVATAGKCLNGLVFNEGTQSCDYKTDENCPDVDSVTQDDLDLLCTYIQIGVFFGSPESCVRWNKCTSTKSKSDECTGYSFNVQTQACDQDVAITECQQYKDDGNGGTGGSGGNNEKDDEGEDCSQVADKLKTIAALQCSSYLKCEDGKYVKHPCTAGNYFDTETKTCISRKDAINECDRCDGTSLTFVNRPNDDCKGYYYCVDGKRSNDEGALCTNDKYFDEKLGGCVKDEVTYASCLKCSYTGDCPAR